MLMLIPLFAAAIILIFWGLFLLLFRCKNGKTRFVNLDDAIGGSSSKRNTPKQIKADLALDVVAGAEVLARTQTLGERGTCSVSNSAGTSNADNLVPYLNFYGDRIVVTFIVVLFLAHFTLTKSALRFFSCRALADGIPGTYLVADLSIRCDAASAMGWMLGVGVPGLVVWGLGSE